MTTGFGGNVREEPPYAEQRFRHPETGEVAVLSVRLSYPTSMAFHAVIAARPDRSNIPGIQWGCWAKDIEQAREVWAQRQRRLRVAGSARPRTALCSPAASNGREGDMAGTGRS